MFIYVCRGSPIVNFHLHICIRRNQNKTLDLMKQNICCIFKVQQEKKNKLTTNQNNNKNFSLYLFFFPTALTNKNKKQQQHRHRRRTQARYKILKQEIEK